MNNATNTILGIVLPILFSFLLSCQPSAEQSDYFGQNYPGPTPVIFAPDIVSVKGRLEHGISFTPDADELAFGVLEEKDFNGKIFYSKRIDESWTEPIVFEPLKDKSVYLPYFSPNGRFLLYTQSKSQKENVYTDIWRIEKKNDNWVSPELIPAPVSSSSREANACMAYNGTIYFSSNRNCEGKEDCYTADLFYSKPEDNGYNDVEIISELNSSNDEESVFISPNEEYIIFCRYTGQESGVDLYISYRNVNDQWTEPQMVDSTINSQYWERRPFVSNDNKFLFFTRLQIDETGLNESDIFWVNTSRLFKPFVYNPLGNITIPSGTEFQVSIPGDYFKDIDDDQLIYALNSPELDWLNFDSEEMMLSGVAPIEGEFELIILATDKNLNTTEDEFTISVIR